jgi:Bacterial Ig-like domain (group 3)
MRIRSSAIRMSVGAALLVATVSAVPASAGTAIGATSTTTTVTAKNPLGTTTGKLVVTAKVRPTTGTGTGTPSGSCAFQVDTTTIGTKPVNARGNCSLTTHVKLGSHTVHVAYSGDASFAASVGSTPIDVVH